MDWTGSRWARLGSEMGLIGSEMVRYGLGRIGMGSAGARDGFDWTSDGSDLD